MDTSFPSLGDVFADKYQIECELGRGGFARVYRATRTDLETAVALKIMRPRLLVDSAQEDPRALEALVNRFKQEARTISQLRSPQTVTMLDYGRTEAGMLYMVLEFIDGKTLGEVLEEDGALPPDRVVRILEQVLRGLHEAHEFGVLHRDIKPGNIMVFDHLGERDLVKVLDFGIGKVINEAGELTQMDLTADNQLLGTPRYLAPEYIRDGELTPASDIYSLGLVSYELLTGERAIDANSSVQIIGKHLDPTPIELPRAPDVTLALRQIVEKMAAKDPNNRFSSAVEVLEALRAFKNGQDVTGLLARPPQVSSTSESKRPEVPIEERVHDDQTATIGSFGLSGGRLVTSIGAVIVVLAVLLAALVLWNSEEGEAEQGRVDDRQTANEEVAPSDSLEQGEAAVTASSEGAPGEDEAEPDPEAPEPVAPDERQLDDQAEQADAQKDESQKVEARRDKPREEKSQKVEAKRSKPAETSEKAPKPPGRTKKSPSRTKAAGTSASRTSREQQEAEPAKPSDDSESDESDDDDSSVYLPVE